MEWSYDGSPIQAGTSRGAYALTGERAHFSIIGLREMVIVARYYVDDPNNQSKRFVEYAVRDPHTSEVYPGARQLSAMGGVDDGDDNTLSPSTNLLPGATGVTGALVTEQTPMNVVDGDQVLVTFIEGSRSRPVIVGVFHHSASAYGATTAQGERRLTLHKGTSIEIQSDGTYVIKHKSGSFEQFYADGSIDVVPDTILRLGDHAATDDAMRGTTYRAAEDTMLSSISTCLAALSAYVTAIQGIADPTHLATPAALAALSACQSAISSFQAAGADYLSTKVKISV